MNLLRPVPGYSLTRRCAVALLTGALAAGAAWAEKPDWAGGGGKGHGRGDDAPRTSKHVEREGREGRGGRHETERRWDGEPRAERHDAARRDERERRGARDDRDERAWREPRAERDRHAQRPPRDTRPVAVLPPGRYFDDGQRRHVHQWYQERWRAGHCPPGLAKKRNGCMPPGQARRWAVGRPLPAGLVYYRVPQPLLLQLGPAPAGYGYVRVAGDILLMSLGTRVVIDAVLW